MVSATLLVRQNGRSSSANGGTSTVSRMQSLLPARRSETSPNARTRHAVAEKKITWRLPERSRPNSENSDIHSRVQVACDEPAAPIVQPEPVVEGEAIAVGAAAGPQNCGRPESIRHSARGRPVSAAEKQGFGDGAPLSCRELRKKLGFTSIERERHIKAAPTASPARRDEVVPASKRVARKPVGKCVGRRSRPKQSEDADVGAEAERLPISRMLLFSEQVGKFSALSEEGVEVIAAMLGGGTNGRK